MSLVVQGVVVKPDDIPYGRKVKLPKSMVEMSDDIVPTDKGYHEGEQRQYRGPDGIHIYEYENHVEIHRDRKDPRDDGVGHLIFDAPEILFSVGAAGIASSLAYRSVYNKKKNNVGTAIITGIIAAIAVGLIVFFIFKAMRDFGVERFDLSRKTDGRYIR